MNRAGTALFMWAVAACSPAPVDSPPPVFALKPDWHHVTRFLDSAVSAGAAPGAVLAVTHRGTRFVHGTGELGADQPSPVDASTIYDLASLTKVVGLTSAVMLAVMEGKLDLDVPVQRYVPQFEGPGKQQVTARMLLAHAGGLPAWRPLFREVTGRNAAFALIDSIPLEVEPGTRELYSDLGAILLTQIIEVVYGERLDFLLTRRLLNPLGMTSTGFLPPADWYERIAPTELDPWRGRILRGEAHDENAYIMDGVSGHAGLFGSAEDLLRFSEWLLEAGQAHGRTARTVEVSSPASAGPPVHQSVIHEFTRRQNLIPGSSRALGWDTPSPGSSAGSILSPRSFGHTGFTGTSLWIDPDHQLAIVLLSNRVNPTRENPRWTPVRAAVSDLVMTTLFEDAP
jgi:CubicO group peptidase (beta-lactamase class C family)